MYESEIVASFVKHFFMKQVLTTYYLFRFSDHPENFDSKIYQSLNYIIED